VTPAWDMDVSQGVMWAPVIEAKNTDAFLTKKMFGLLQAGNVVAVPTLMGFNSEESLFFNQGMWSNIWDIKITTMFVIRSRCI
jgi:hypothetical protein